MFSSLLGTIFFQVCVCMSTQWKSAKSKIIQSTPMSAARLARLSKTSKRIWFPPDLSRTIWKRWTHVQTITRVTWDESKCLRCTSSSNSLFMLLFLFYSGISLVIKWQPITLYNLTLPLIGPLIRIHTLLLESFGLLCVIWISCRLLPSQFFKISFKSKSLHVFPPLILVLSSIWSVMMMPKFYGRPHPPLTAE